MNGKGQMERNASSLESIEVDFSRTRDLTRWVQMPEDTPPAVVEMLRATLPSYWHAYVEADGNPQDAEAFWQFATSGGRA